MPVLSLLFSYRGGIGRAKYFLTVLLAVICLAGALFGAAVASDPKGSSDGALVLAFPLLILAVWIFTAAVTKRLRDAGWAAWMKAAYALSPIALFFAAASASNVEMVIAVGGAALVLLPALAGPANRRD